MADYVKEFTIRQNFFFTEVLVISLNNEIISQLNGLKSLNIFYFLLFFCENDQVKYYIIE